MSLNKARHIQTVPTFWANIYVGLYDRETGITGTVDKAREICQEYVDEVGLCVSFTPTEFIYSHGGEPGLIVGLINYPRFPSDKNTIKAHAGEIAARLQDAFNQYRVSIVFPDKTLMFSSSKAS